VQMRLRRQSPTNRSDPTDATRTMKPVRPTKRQKFVRMNFC
jgi:hypothetical protein